MFSEDVERAVNVKLASISDLWARPVVDKPKATPTEEFKGPQLGLFEESLK